MNWSYLGIAALLPLAVALGLTLAAGAFQALRLNREGGSSRIALRRLLRTLALVFPLAFLAAALWDGRHTWRGLAGAALGRPADQRALGQLRAGGQGFLMQDPAKAAHWFRKAADGGDARGQYFLARAMASGSGLPRDPEGARRWAEASARQGDLEAMILRGDLDRSADPSAAEAWYRKAGESLAPALARREAEACLTYGLLLLAGKGTPRDPVEGLAWMQVAERRGLPRFRTLIIRLTETQLPPAQREAAVRRAEGLLAPTGPMPPIRPPAAAPAAGP